MEAKTMRKSFFMSATGHVNRFFCWDYNKSRLTSLDPWRALLETFRGLLCSENNRYGRRMSRITDGNIDKIVSSKRGVKSNWLD